MSDVEEAEEEEDVEKVVEAEEEDTALMEGEVDELLLSLLLFIPSDTLFVESFPSSCSNIR